MTEQASPAAGPRPEERRFYAQGSSNIAWVAWYEAPNPALVVSFQSGARYRYQNVPLEVYLELRAAPSVGVAFDKLVKKAGFAFEQLLPITDRAAPTGEVPGTTDQR